VSGSVPERMLGLGYRPFVAERAPAHGYRPFVVVTRSRTGSNMLISLLDSHDAIIARGELVARVGEAGPAAILDPFFKPRRAKIEAVGFKAFYYHPLDGESERLWEYLRGIDGLLVIHLRRLNTLRALLSREIAAKRDVWKLKDDDERGALAERTVRLDPQTLLESFEQTRAWWRETEARWSDREMVAVDYEDVAADPSGQVHRICEYLGVEFAQVTTDLRKQNPEPLSSLLENYDEVVAALKGSEWESFLHTD
jgi:LPS sulfotransferase NodH